MPKILKVDADSSDVQTAPLAAGDMLRVFVRATPRSSWPATSRFPRLKNILDEAPRLELTIGDGQDSPFRGHDRAHRLISARYSGRQRDIHPTLRLCGAGAPGHGPGGLRHFVLFKGSIWRLSDRPMLKSEHDATARGGADVPRRVWGDCSPCP